MSKSTLDILRMTKPTMNIAPHWHANYNWHRVLAIGAIINSGKLVSDLHHGCPDIIGKLNLRHWPIASKSKPYRNSNNTCFSQGRIKAAIAKLFGKLSRSRKNAAFTVGYILSKNEHLVIFTQAFS